MAVQRAYKRTDKANVYLTIQAQHVARRSYRAIAADYGKPITHGDIGRILHDNVWPKGAAKCHALGLPVLLPAPACLHCGEVHIAKRCPHSPRQYKSLFDYSTKALRQMYENREVLSTLDRLAPL